jgi:hypothetical protein
VIEYERKPIIGVLGVRVVVFDANYFGEWKVVPQKDNAVSATFFIEPVPNFNEV